MPGIYIYRLLLLRQVAVGGGCICMQGFHRRRSLGVGGNISVGGPGITHCDDRPGPKSIPLGEALGEACTARISYSYLGNIVVGQLVGVCNQGVWIGRAFCRVVDTFRVYVTGILPENNRCFKALLTTAADCLTSKMYRTHLS